MKILKSIEGSALAFVLVAMTVAFVLVGGIITVSMSDNDQVMYQADYMNAYYIARAGAESMAMEMMRIDNTTYSNFNIKQSASATNMLEGKGDVSVTVEKVMDHYMINSEGTYESIKANVGIRMIYADKLDFKYAAYSIESMGTEKDDIGIGPVVGTLASGKDIHIKSNDIGPKTQVIENVYVDVDITVPMIPDTSIFTTVDNPNANMDIIESTIFTNFNTPKNKTGNDKFTITINTNNAKYVKNEAEDYEAYFTLSKVATGGEWLIVYFEDEAVFNGTIKVIGSNNCMIIVKESLYLGGGLSIEGDGIVEMYVIDQSTTDKNDYDLTLQGNEVFGIGPEKFNDAGASNTSPGQLLVYIYGDRANKIYNSMNMDINSNIYGYIFGPEAFINLKNGNTNIYGGIYTMDIDLNAEVSIVNPNSLNTTNILYKAMQIDYWE